MGVRESERLRGREAVPEGVCVCDWGGCQSPIGMVLLSSHLHS